MIAELNELRWLIWPLYPFLLVVMLGLWLYLRFGRAQRLELRASMFGVSLEVKVDNSKDPVQEVQQCPNKQ